MFNEESTPREYEDRGGNEHAGKFSVKLLRNVYFPKKCKMKINISFDIKEKFYTIGLSYVELFQLHTKYCNE